MSDNSVFNSGPQRPGINSPATTPRPQSSPARSEAQTFGRSKAPQRNPLDLDTAFNRLDKLLTRDGDTPRSDAPARGYYLNILA
ncbi:hypothetical protein [Aestuariispira ectoiniformans]|uniref:hypothetical protein n=1 Tax=Aestuariispira ectoiniformans TaxID=2775080 RepID=UPI00223B9F98|nr:hypothetical protein [Aestuariispira ectoiniformans]